jgi:hypothetical protein
MRMESLNPKSKHCSRIKEKVMKIVTVKRIQKTSSLMMKKTITVMTPGAKHIKRRCRI